VIFALAVAAGAEIGGGFPGAIFAFALVASSGIAAAYSEAACLCITLLFGVADAFFGLAIGKTVCRLGFRGSDVILPIAAGLSAGPIGYYWLYFHTLL
jgi:hypothetical protein